MIGLRLGHYRVIQKIGAGGMGEVYRARDEHLNRDVALKFLASDSKGAADGGTELLREAQSACSLNDPHICTIYEVGEANGRRFIVMELIEGRPLSSAIPAEGLPPVQVLRFGVQIAAALAHAHDHGIIHRDIKASNIVVTPAGVIKVLDFGLATRLNKNEIEEVTRSADTAAKFSAMAGTLPYMAPEQFRGATPDARSDVWALGIVLYEMSAGHRPFEGQTGYELSSAILRGAPGALPTDTPAGLRIVVDRCLEKEPGQRYQHATEVHAALELMQASSGTTVPASTSARSAVTDRGWLRRVGWILGSMLGVVLGLLVALDVGGLRNKFIKPKLAPRIQSIAVLPLENLSHDPEQQYFADGFTEELTTDLAKIHNLRVISRTSAMRYRGSNEAIPQIAKDLGVDGVLEGSIERVGNRVRINAQLIYAPTDTHVWAEKYDRDVQDVLTLQEEVARAVSQEIQVQVAPLELKGLSKRRQVKPEAYEDYSKGRFFLNLEESAAETQKALEYFRRAIGEQPDYAEAYAGIADAYLLLGEPEIGSGVPPQECLREAKAAALKATELDSSIGEVHLSLARVLEVHDWDWAAAEKEFKKAIELSPNNAKIHQWYAEYLQALGRNDESIAEIKHALGLDPLSDAIKDDVGLVFYTARRYDEALLQFRTIQSHLGMCWVYREKKRYEEALAECQNSVAQNPTGQLGLASLAHVYALAGRRDQAINTIENVVRVSKDRYVSPYVISYGQIGLGRKDRAFNLLEEAFRIHDLWMVWLKVDPSMESLRSDVRYKDLIRRIGFPQ